MIITVLHPTLVAWLAGNGRSVMRPSLYKFNLQHPPTAVAEIHGAMASHGPAAMLLHTRELLTLLPGRWEHRGRVQTLLAAPVTHVVDLSGCWLPGQSIPLVALLADPVLAAARPDAVRLLRCDRGEPASPRTMEEGILWRTVTATYDRPGSTPKTTTRDLARDDLAGAAEFFNAAWEMVGFDAEGVHRG